MRGDVVRVGVDAPRHIQVHRQELLVEIAESQPGRRLPARDAVAGLSQLVAPRDEPDAGKDTGPEAADGTDGTGPEGEDPA